MNNSRIIANNIKLELVFYGFLKGSKLYIINKNTLEESKLSL